MANLLKVKRKNRHSTQAPQLAMQDQNDVRTWITERDPMDHATWIRDENWMSSSTTPRIAQIDDFEPGQRVTVTKTFTDDDLRHFIEITGDTNPLHVDDVFAAGTKFGRRVLHGMLTASIFSTMVGMLMPGTGAIYRSQTLRFLLPVHVGDTVTAHFVLRSVDRTRHRLDIDAWIENAAGERVIEGTCEAGILRLSNPSSPSPSASS